MKSYSIIVSDSDMDRLSRLARALKHSLFRDQTAVGIVGANPRERGGTTFGAYSEKRDQDEFPYSHSGLRHTKEALVYAGVPGERGHLQRLDFSSRASGACSPRPQTGGRRRGESSRRGQKVEN